MSVNEPLIRPPQRVSLVDLAYDAIVDAIIDQQFQPGSQIGIDWLATEFQMSNTPIREALVRAAARRLVIQNNNRGFTVSPMLTAKEFHDIFEMRHMLEIHALSTCDLRSPQPTVDKLMALIAQMPSGDPAQQFQDRKGYLRADRQFHLALVSMSDNTFLVKSWDDLHIHLHVGRLYTHIGQIDFNYSIEEHQDIVSMLRAGDRGGLISKASQHIKQAQQRLQALAQP